MIFAMTFEDAVNTDENSATGMPFSGGEHPRVIEGGKGLVVTRIAKAYNRLYAELPILHESHSGLRNNRLLFSALTARTLAWLMSLLGIPMPERM